MGGMVVVLSLIVMEVTNEFLGEVVLLSGFVAFFSFVPFCFVALVFLLRCPWFIVFFLLSLFFLFRWCEM